MRFMTVNAPILQQFLWREWQRRGVFAWILWPLSRIFWIVMTARRASFSAGWRRTFRSAQPVMIVGNLTVGGAGKPPLLLRWLKHYASRALGRASFRAVMARASKRRGLTLNADAREVGDEPLLIAQRTGAPVWVCPDRAAA